MLCHKADSHPISLQFWEKGSKSWGVLDDDEIKENCASQSKHLPPTPISVVCGDFRLYCSTEKHIWFKCTSLPQPKWNIYSKRVFKSSLAMYFTNLHAVDFYWHCCLFLKTWGVWWLEKWQNSSNNFITFMWPYWLRAFDVISYTLSLRPCSSLRYKTRDCLPHHLTSRKVAFEWREWSDIRQGVIDILAAIQQLKEKEGSV